MNQRTVLISGASVAGPVLAYWLRRHGIVPTVVERTSRPRLATGGHAVDIFGAAVEVVDRMGLLDQVQAARTGTTTMRLRRTGRAGVDIPIEALVAGMSQGGHVELMRGELARILHQAVSDAVEHIFGDEITALHDDGSGVDVTFAAAPPRRFDLVVGADGLHSGVRRLTFGPEERFAHHLGGYLAAASYTDPGLEPGVLHAYNSAGRVAVTYPVWQSRQARATFIFRAGADQAPHHRDLDGQRRFLRGAFASSGDELTALVATAEDAEDFYLDAITQIRMDTWSKGRVTLVGDAAYSPGPALGAGTSLAPVGAYLLAHHLADSAEHTTAFSRYEHEMADVVRTARQMGPSMMRSVVPASALQARAIVPAAKALTVLPAWLRRRVLSGINRPLQALGRARLPELRSHEGRP